MLIFLRGPFWGTVN